MVKYDSCYGLPSGKRPVCFYGDHKKMWCSSARMHPISAELLYEKADNTLKLSNTWAGHYIMLNPDYKSQVRASSQKRINIWRCSSCGKFFSAYS